MFKHVKSTDPRKKLVMAALKAKTGANKITSVYDLGNSVFQGTCHKGKRAGYENLGVFTVTLEEVLPTTTLKTFEQLTTEQQTEAYAFAKRTLQEALTSGLLQVEGKTSSEYLETMAKDAAEGGQYTQEGKPHVDGLAVPYYFQGGCV